MTFGDLGLVRDFLVQIHISLFEQIVVWWALLGAGSPRSTGQSLVEEICAMRAVIGKWAGGVRGGRGQAKAPLPPPPLQESLSLQLGEGVHQTRREEGCIPGVYRNMNKIPRDKIARK